MLFVIAWRNIWRNKARSLVIISSVTVGLWAGVFIVALYNGMAADRIRIVVQEEISHLQIHHPAFLEDYEAQYIAGEATILEKKIGELSGIKAISARSLTRGMLANANSSAGVLIIGIDPAAEAATTMLKEKMLEGDFFASGKRNPVLIGKKLAERFNITIGSKVVLTITDKDNNLTAGAFKVNGIYQSKNASLDEMNLYVQRQDLNALLATPDAVHEVAILLEKDEMLPTIQAKLQAILPDLKTENWRQISPESDLITSYTSQSAIIIVAIIMIALAFGIVNTMLMSVLERTREIGMLMALGMRKERLVAMIIGETCMLTMIGVPFGLLLAWTTVEWFSRKGIDISVFADEVMSDFGFSTVLYPVLPWDNVFQVVIIVICAALLASINPAIKTVRLKPVEAIKQ